MYAVHVIAGGTLLLKKLANAIYADIKGDTSIARRISYRNGLAGCRRAAITAACQKTTQVPGTSRRCMLPAGDIG